MIQSILDWWVDLDQSNQLFWGIAIIATALFVVQIVISLFGLVSDFETEFDDFDDGFSIISFRSIVAFLMFFGWGGVVSLYEGMNMSKSVMIAFLTGFKAMLGVAYVFS